jgi:2-polyprenyl-3-methyl-5-hydroxy-6-metoxy-1,4-benzoquinol methylase
MLCRACNSDQIFDAIDLGNIPIAAGFAKNITDQPELYETKMVVCQSCGLGQTSIDLDESLLFSYYNFRTSISKSFLEHSRQYCEMVIEKYKITNDDWVLELASNDGYMLKYFKEKNIDVLGVDPARNLAIYSATNGVPTISEFFNSDLAKQILNEKGYPKLIIANNVLAHVPNIQDFMDGISILCSQETVVSIENPTIINILEKDHFDTIFHEHYSYLSCNSVSKLSNKFGLTLFDVESINTHGGSNRYWLSKSKQMNDTVKNTINYESNIGLMNKKSWDVSYSRIKNNVDLFKQKVEDLNNSGATVCGYTASAKSTVLLNFAKINNGQIKAIADDAVEKQNHFLLGPNIPITSIENVLSLKPTDIIVFSWNIYDEIKNKILLMGYKNINVWVWNQ